MQSRGAIASGLDKLQMIMSGSCLKHVGCHLDLLMLTLLLSTARGDSNIHITVQKSSTLLST